MPTHFTNTIRDTLKKTIYRHSTKAKPKHYKNSKLSPFEPTQTLFNDKTTVPPTQK